MKNSHLDHFFFQSLSNLNWNEDSYLFTIEIMWILPFIAVTGELVTNNEGAIYSELSSKVNMLGNAGKTRRQHVPVYLSDSLK